MFIPGNLLALNCTKIVQNSVLVYKCGKQRHLALLTASEGRNADRMPALLGQNAMISANKYTSEVLDCQEKTGKKSERNEKRFAAARRHVSGAISRWLAAILTLSMSARLLWNDRT